MFKSWSALLATTLLVPAFASAQQVLTRTDLNTLLPAQNIETFAGFSALTPGGSSLLFSGATQLSELDNSTDVNGFGTGLVTSFLRFEGPELQANGGGYFGSSTENILSNAGSLTIFFLSFVNAVGVDLFDYNTRAEPFSVSVYGPGSVLLGSVDFAGTNAPAVEFFGWQNAGGIDHVIVGATLNGWSSLIDDVTFGTVAGSVTATPEPASVFLMGTGFVAIAGLVRRQKKTGINTD